MSCCSHCNFRNTSKCDVEEIWQKFEEGEITEDEANELAQTALMNCEDGYYDYQIKEGECRDER